MYRAEVTCNPDASFKVKSAGHEFVMDINGKGIIPPDALLASLAGCLGVYIQKYFRGSGLVLKDFSITAEAEFGKEKPVGFKEISVSIDLKGAGIDEHRKAPLLEFLKNCPIHNTLKMNPVINMKVI
ncbi:MAG: OsmC family protein [Candidatus Omnitrophota bacterium]